MDYYMIGQRIRKLRKKIGLSQEELGERVNISTTHMSHIETGNTKLSLPVLADIAAVLRVRTDDLLYDPPAPSKNAAVEEINAVLQRCTDQQCQVIADIVRTAKQAMDKHF